MISNGLVVEDFTLNKINSVLKSKPSSILIQGAKGSGTLKIANSIAADILNINESKLVYSANYLYLDASIVGIEELRDLLKKLRFTVPGTGRIRRVVVIANFDNFYHEAQNASLKTLEEPPLDTMIILTASDQKRVLPTVLSRVHSIKIPPISYKTALGAYSHIDKDMFRRSFYMSDGEAELLSDLIREDNRHEFVRAILTAKDLLQLPKYRRLSEVDRLLKNSDIKVELLLDGFVRVLEAAYRQAVGTNSSSLPTIQTYGSRLELALSALEDLKSGASHKLVLTRLFIAL